MRLEDNFPEIKNLEGYTFIDNVPVAQKLGFCARTTAQMVKEAIRHKYNEIYFERMENYPTFSAKETDERINAKSIMGLMMLAAGQGTLLRIIVKGTDAHSRRIALRIYSGTTTKSECSAEFDRFKER